MFSVPQLGYKLKAKTAHVSALEKLPPESFFFQGQLEKTNCTGVFQSVTVEDSF